ncbi:tripartite tricarboxylate transporter permease [Elioraea tepidiphila]|jgi:TctA family transporter|uniref:tripartite tricarboxylate transporter permease n=1 Tax=Elioraea tepidiphila TaxID=457934 RepID=UPI00037AC056|nr:tripartite tricarboxylate transporter permease [Elioraea tepidiphila]
MDAIARAVGMVADPAVLATILVSSLFGLFVGFIPGLTATMATALLVPFAMKLDPVAAIAAIVAATAMAIFAGDIPGTLLRLPGTPAAAAYVDQAYRLAKAGRAAEVLGVNVVFSAFGGLIGTTVLVLFAPVLADYALSLSSFEFFWLAVLGLSCAVFVVGENAAKGTASLLFGLLLATVGRDYTSGFPRFTLGAPELLDGVPFVPALIGFFALPEIVRTMRDPDTPAAVPLPRNAGIFSGIPRKLMQWPLNLLRSATLGTVVGALPGAGADIAAWTSYALSRRLTRDPAAWQTDSVEGIVDATSANNASLAGAWIPALVFAIPGDTITAIAIAVLYLKNVTPGPSIFLENAHTLYAVFLCFFLANLLMVPLGWTAIRIAVPILKLPRRLLMAPLLLFACLGAYAVENSLFGIGVMLVAGLIGFWMEENGYPVGPTVLGMVMGRLVEEHLMSSLIRVQGDPLRFFERPIAAALAAFTLLVWLLPLVRILRRTWARAG